MVAKRSNRKKLKRRERELSPVRKKVLRSGYVAGFIEALRLQNGTPSGVTSAKTMSQRTKWARRAFESHSLDPVLGVIPNAQTMKRTKAGAPPNFSFVGRLAKSYLPEKFVRVSVPDQTKHAKAGHVSGARSTAKAKKSHSRLEERLVWINSGKNSTQLFELSQNDVANTSSGKPLKATFTP
jgi:hypothetical protein